MKKEEQTVYTIETICVYNKCFLIKQNASIFNCLCMSWPIIGGIK